MRRILIALTLGALAIGTLGAPASAAGTIRVDKDGKASAGSCGGTATAPKTIKAAIAAANAGDTIIVCPGTYTEQVVIGAAKDRLTLRSSVRYGATIASPADPVKRDDAFSLVLIRQGADRVTLEGFKLTHRATQPPDPTAGDDAERDCGLDFGVQVDGTRTRVLFNNLRVTGRYTLSECGVDYGIGAGWNDHEGPNDGATANVRNNVVRATTLAGIVAGGGETSLTAYRNAVRFYHEQTVFTASIATGRSTPFGRLPRFGGPRPSGPGPAPFAGILLFGAQGDIIENTVESGPAAGPLADNGRPYLGVGIGVMDLADVLIEGNRVYRAFSGIGVNTLIPLVAGDPLPDGPIVRNNLAVQNYFGIILDNTADGLVEGNRTTSNVVGLFLNDDTSGFTVRNNVAVTNIDIDCVDDTGPDLVSLDNEWTDNTGWSDSPDGICEPPIPN